MMKAESEAVEGPGGGVDKEDLFILAAGTDGASTDAYSKVFPPPEVCSKKCGVSPCGALVPVCCCPATTE